MARFSIRDIEKFTGVKAHTLRIWEQRYNILTPKRTDTNIRYYDDADLKQLLGISILLNNGYRISKAACMCRTEVDGIVREITEKNSSSTNQIMALVSAMLELDEQAFNKLLDTQILQLGFENTVIKVLFPFLKHLGMLWMTGTVHPAHEHFVSNLIKQKIYVATEGQIPKYGSDSPKFLLYLPEGESHEIGLLFANYVLRNRGHQTIYLGQNTPEEDIVQVFELYNPDVVFLTVTACTTIDEMPSFIEHTASLWKGKHIYIAGKMCDGLKASLPAGMNWVKDLEDLMTQLGDLRKPS
ncbi:MAG: MerR family transcriptional regulator [Bacteroidota bacterium]|nr:MerR family transcriptional regulator [Bacteroidota bacterium]